MSKNNSLLLGTAVALTGAVAYAALTARANPSTVPCTLTVKPKECLWLDEDGFRVFSAMVDTFIPEYSDEELDIEAVKKAIDVICPGLFEKSRMTVKELRSHRPLLSRGAIQENVDSLAAIALQNNLPIYSAKELAGLFKVMATSVGNGMVTGFFGPFHLLTRKQREEGLHALRDSMIPALRAGFQVSCCIGKHVQYSSDVFDSAVVSVASLNAYRA